MSRPKIFKTPRPTLSVRVSPEVKKELKRLAADEKRTLNNYLVLLLEQHVRQGQSTQLRAV